MISKVFLVLAIVLVESDVLMVRCKPMFGPRKMQFKRSAAPDHTITEEHVDERGLRPMAYDDYPMVVPKRAAVLLDRLMVALHHALEDDDGSSIRKPNQMQRDASYLGSSLPKGKLESIGLHPLQPDVIKASHSNLANDHDIARFSPNYDTRENTDIYNVVKAGANSAAFVDEDIDYDAIPNELFVARNGINNSVSPGGGKTSEKMGLQRRGHDAGLGPNKSRVYWRCYFNAVTCF